MQEPSGGFGSIIEKRIRGLEKQYKNIEVSASKSGKLTSDLVERWYFGTLFDAIKAKQEAKMMDDDDTAVLLLADSWSGHTKASQKEDLSRMGARLLKIPPGTTDHPQPLDVNYNRQLKIFYNRVLEEAFYADTLPNVTSREGILNLHSLIHDQMSSPKYKDMILLAWKHTDPSFNTTELSSYPPKMVNQIQFDFDPSDSCQVP